MTTWKISKNRGFYYGPETDTPWNHDLMWKRRVDHETKAQQFFLSKQVAEDGDDDAASQLPPVRVGTPGSVRSGFSMASRRSGAKTLQRSAPSALGGKGSSVLGSNISAYREKDKESLINMLGRERVKALDKEREFVKMLKKEHEARMMSDRKMRSLEEKLNMLANSMGDKFETGNASKSFNNFSTAMYKQKK